MSNHQFVVAYLGAALTFGGLWSVSVNAGPLAPPAGPIAPTSKPLAEVEPRVAINSTNTPGNAACAYLITQPGSYYLTGNLSGSATKDAVIFVAADGVTIDLNGFTVTGAGSAYGFDCGTVKGLSIKNGTIAECGTNCLALDSGTGVQLSDITARGAGETSIGVGAAAVVESCRVIQSGTQAFVAGKGSTLRDCTAVSAGDVAYLVDASVLERCTAVGAGGNGFSVGSGSVVSECIANSCNSGFGGVQDNRFSMCTAEKNLGIGIVSGFRGSVRSCTVVGSGAEGILANDGTTVQDCTLSDNTGHGINADSKCVLTGNNCNGNGATNAGVTSAGIFLAAADCRVEGNNLVGNDWGIRANAAGNFIVRNTASGNLTINYTSAAGNAWGPIVAATSSPSFSSNSSGGGLGSTDPNSNFSY